MSSNWPLISLAAIVCMKRRFWSVTHGTYNTLCPPITQREAIAAACSAVLPLIALSTKIECPDAASCAAYRTVLSTSPISYSPWGSASNGLYSGICASFSASAASLFPASASRTVLPVGPWDSWLMIWRLSTSICEDGSMKQPRMM